MEYKYTATTQGILDEVDRLMADDRDWVPVKWEEWFQTAKSPQFHVTRQMRERVLRRHKEARSRLWGK